MSTWKDRLKALDKLRIGKALAMSLLPLICCVVACALEGHTLADVYLPASQWNDELFYFKQVEGILHFGYPQGYFGFNESHALVASFAAWSPVLVMPWLVWGLLFGWSLLSPVYCNIFLMMLAVLLFVYIVKPNRKQLLMLTVMYAAFTPFTRFTLSGMPEVFCFFMVIVTLAVEMSYQEKEGNGKLAVLFVLTSLMTLMRPYLILFMLLPIYFLIKKKRWKGAAGSAAVVLVTGVIYVSINHFLAAEYFTPLFEVRWLTTFLDKGIWAGLKNLVYMLYHGSLQFMNMLIQGFRTGLAHGALFGGFLLVLLLLAIQTVSDFVRKRRDKLLLHGYLTFCLAGMYAALLLMYKLKEGGRHLITFIAVGIFAICMMETKFYRKAIAAAAVFAYLYSVMALEPYDYQIPFRSKELVAEADGWQTAFDEQLSLSGKKAPNYENVVIWTFNDEVDGKSVLTPWQMLYALPEGFGISCCYTDYISDNLERLQSKYIALPSGGGLDARCKELGYGEVERSGELVVYERY